MNARLLAITTILLLVISGCGQSYNPEQDKDCEGCDLHGADLSGANLTGVALTAEGITGANLSAIKLDGINNSGVNLDGVNLDGVIGADFTGALNVPRKYR